MLAAVVALAITALFVYVWASRRPFEHPDTTGWQTGDIFFSAGNSWRSAAVRLLGSDSKDETTHSGFIVVNEQGEPMMVHMSTETGRIAMESIAHYGAMNDVRTITARRLRVAPDTVALRRELMRLMAEGKRFDNEFDLQDTTEYYCTELVLHVLNEQNHPAFKGFLERRVVYPVDLETSADVEKIRGQ